MYWYRGNSFLTGLCLFGLSQPHETEKFTSQTYELKNQLFNNNGEDAKTGGLGSWLQAKGNWEVCIIIISLLHYHVKHQVWTRLA